MYAEYYYVAGATEIDILSDLVALITGTTDVNQLSASADKTKTTIVSNVAADWQVWDDQSASGYVVLRRLITDSTQYYKYVRLRLSGGSIYLELYRDWNNTTQSGTDLTYLSNSSAYAQRYDLGAGGLVALVCTPSLLGLLSSTPIGWGSPTGGGPTMIVERTRDSVWDIPDSGVEGSEIPVLWWNPYLTSAYTPRRLRMNTTTGTLSSTLTGVTARYSVMNEQGYNVQTVSNGLASVNGGLMQTDFTNSSSQSYILSPAFVRGGPYDDMRYSSLGGSISDRSDVWIAPARLGAPLDSITVGTSTYVLWPFSGNGRIAVPGG